MKAIARLKDWLFNPPLDGPAATILLRLMAGGVFVSEGILKFVYSNQGVGRFTKLGFPLPQLTASVIGAWEIVAGVLIMVGLLTRGAAPCSRSRWRWRCSRPRSGSIWERRPCRSLRHRPRSASGRSCTRAGRIMPSS